MPRILVQRVSFDDGDFQRLDVVKPDLRVAVAPVILRTPQGVRGCGTSFCISALASGKAIYVTARHVVSAFIPQVASGFSRVRLPDGHEPFLLIPRDVSTPAAAQALHGVRIEDVSLAPEHNDIALLIVDLAGFEFPPTSAIMFHLALAPPVVGEKCCALGYSEMSVGESAQPAPDTFGWQGPLHASQSVIEEVHGAGRDRSMMTFPSFRTSAFYESGMSGGPIARTDGRIVGVVSTSFGPDAGTAYGALMGSIIEMGVKLPSDAGEIEEFDFQRLINHNLVSVDDTTVTLNRSPEGASLNWV
jgi:hypothetical protein